MGPVAPQPPQPLLPANTPVITLDYCQGAARATAAKTSCKKVITKAEFDRILDAAIPKSRRSAGADVIPQVKQAVAKEYLNMYVMASEAEKRGYPAKDPMAEEMLRLSRMQVLSMALNQELQEKAKPTDAEVESYYKDNPSAYVEVGLRRLYIPKPAPVTPPAPTPIARYSRSPLVLLRRLAIWRATTTAPAAARAVPATAVRTALGSMPGSTTTGSFSPRSNALSR